MTRAEFLEQLRLALQGNVSQAQINEHLRYYESYIIEESRKGRSEQEVIDSLGEPRLIARTLIDTSEHVGNAYDETYYEENWQKSGNNGRRFRMERNSKGEWNVKYGRFSLNSWYGRILLVLLFILLVIIVCHVMIILLPVLLVVAGVYLIIRLVDGR